jgi:DNA-binding PadR family transcriptional regulator
MRRGRPQEGRRERHGPGHHRHEEFPDFGGWRKFRHDHGEHRGHGPRGGGRGGRARKGDVKAAILALLAERPMGGYEMIQELEDRTGGVWRPSPGSIYPTLQLLEEQGLIEAGETAGKKHYDLTEAGRAALSELGADRKPWEEAIEGINPNYWQLGGSLFQIMVAARQVAEAGDEAQKAEAVEILADTRRRLYALLAGDG